MRVRARVMICGRCKVAPMFGLLVLSWVAYLLIYKAFVEFVATPSAVSGLDPMSRKQAMQDFAG